MTPKEAIEKAIRYFECVRDDAQVVLDSGFGTHKGESDLVYRNRKMYAELAIEALEKQTKYRNRIKDLITTIENICKDSCDRHSDDEHCGLCEYDGAYIGESGYWCNECPGFYKDDCFELSNRFKSRYIDWSEEE